MELEAAPPRQTWRPPRRRQAVPQAIDALDRIAGGAPWGVGECGEHLGARAGPGRRILQSSGSKPGAATATGSPCPASPSPRSAAMARWSEKSSGRLPERGTRAIATSVSIRWRPAGAAPRMCRPSRICISFSSQRWASIALQCLAGFIGEKAEILVEPVARSGGEDLALQIVATAAVDAGGKVIFVDQRLELGKARMGLGAGHRRHQMVDDDGRSATLGLRALAGVVDDEGIDQRRRPRAPTSGQQASERPSALPGSHSRLPCLPQ